MRLTNPARGPWRKEARHVTDRALRYRANACPPPRHALEPPLTKSARPVGDTEKVAQEWLRGASGFERRAILPYQRATVSPQYWPFPASPGHRAANQKNREFVASSFGSPRATLIRKSERKIPAEWFSP